MGFRVRGTVGDNGILGLGFQGSGLRKKLVGCRRPQECIDMMKTAYLPCWFFVGNKGIDHMGTV